MSTRIFIAGAASLLIAACAMSPSQPPAPSLPIATVQAPAPPASATLIPAVPQTAANSEVLPAALPKPIAANPPLPAEHAAHEHTALIAAKKRTGVESPKPPVATTELTGRVALTGSHDRRVSTADYAQTIVYFVPKADPSAPRPEHYSVFTHDRDFNPEAMAVPLGSTLTFVNQDDVRHNVFSVTQGSAFDLGYQAQGTSASHRFSEPGLVLISCKVHRSMEFDLLVVPTTFVARVGTDGRFALRGLPEGAGTLHFWNPRAEPVQVAVKLPHAGTVSQTLVLVKPPLVTQLHVGGSP